MANINTDKYMWAVVGIIITFFLIMGFGGSSFLKWIKENRDTNNAVTTSNSYTNEDFSFSFSYPEDYILNSYIASQTDNTRLTLILIQDSLYTRFPKKQNADELSSGIIVTVFDNEEDLSSRTWMEESPYSDFSSGDGLFTTTHVAGLDAVRYNLSLPRNADSLVVTSDGYVYRFTAIYKDDAEVDKVNFEKILSSISFGIEATKNQ